MNRPKVAFVGAALIAIGVVGLAFAIAPRACDGGLEVYLWSGCASLLVLFSLPFAAHLGHSSAMRVAWALGLLTFGVCAWCVGLFAANVRFICGLGYL
jgi:hypothetical protein